ncbi:MAG: outer membrane beta-barrel protein [Gammaproteobacteria bacterium]|nr:outer membrane beta-barrel protein [Gammaproteobacteria bacterium]
MIDFKHPLIPFLSFLALACSNSIFATATSSPTSNDNLWTRWFNLPQTHLVVSAIGGYANMNTGDSQTYTGTDQQMFVYNNPNNGGNQAVLGAFLGSEWHLPNPDYFTQIGLGYNNFGSTTVSGSQLTGIEPATSTLYQYQYKMKSQQLLVINKWYMTFHQFHPFVLAGIGAAFNHSYAFNISTLETGSINTTATYDSDTRTSFTYGVGLGCDVDLKQNLRFGLSYQFTDLGKSTFENGQVNVNTYHAAVPFALNNSHAYVNQVLATISVVI